MQGAYIFFMFSISIMCSVSDINFGPPTAHRQATIFAGLIVFDLYLVGHVFVLFRLVKKVKNTTSKPILDYCAVSLHIVYNLHID